MSVLTSIPVEIYLEQTPNPESMKFLANKKLTENIVFDGNRGTQNEYCPLANALYEKYDWIAAVLVTNNFITITKNTTNDWYEYFHEIKEFLKMYLQQDLEILTPEYIATYQKSNEIKLEDNSIEGKICELIDKYVKPAVEGDGGFIEFKHFEKGIVTIAMKGSCSGCPSSQITLKSGIEGLLKRMIPEVIEVVAEA